MTSLRWDGAEGTRLFRFRHRAMATEFEIVIAGEERAFAEQAAHAGFREIDMLEEDLSRFRPNSDITRINNLPPGGSAAVGAHTLECLRLSKQYWEQTGGAFDVTVGSLIECWAGRDSSRPEPDPGHLEEARLRCGMQHVDMDEKSHTVRVPDLVPRFDLGAIGKGYAVDRVIETLKEWGIGSALVHGGTSSVFAYGHFDNRAGWPVTMTHPAAPERILQRLRLQERALSGSGIRKGAHIIDPRTAQPARMRPAAWVAASTTAAADALSTACMLMTQLEIGKLQREHPGVWILILEGGGTATEGEPLSFGDLPSSEGSGE